MLKEQADTRPGVHEAGICNFFHTAQQRRKTVITMTDKLVVDFPQVRDLDSTFLSRQQLRAVTFNLKATTVHQFEEEVKTDDEDSSDTAFWYSDEETRAFKRRTMRSVLIYRLLVEAGQDLRLLQNDCIQGVENFISAADFARGMLIKERVIRAVLDGQDQQQQDQFPLAFKSMQFSRFSKSRAHMIGVSTGEDSF